MPAFLTATTARSLLNRAAAAASAKTKKHAISRSFGTSENLVKTALYDLHKELGGDMVPFAGYELPVLYKGGENGGVMKEHLWCRADGKAALFDVSHMGQVCSTLLCLHGQRCLFLVLSFLFVAGFLIFPMKCVGRFVGTEKIVRPFWKSWL